MYSLPNVVNGVSPAFCASVQYGGAVNQWMHAWECFYNHPAQTFKTQ